MVILVLPQHGKTWDKSEIMKKILINKYLKIRNWDTLEKVLDPDSNEVSSSFNDAV